MKLLLRLLEGATLMLIIEDIDPAAAAAAGY